LRFEAVSRRSSLEQLLPPLALFLILLARTGTTLVAGGALALLALAFSLCRLAWLAARPRPGARRLRAVLTVVFAAAILAVSWLQVAPVHRYVDGLSRGIEQQCRQMGACPARIDGWTDASGPTGSDTEMGARMRYALAYRTDGQRFRLCWVVAFGRCRSASGGADVALQPIRPWPWPEMDAAPP
jgi:hypothetical protein